MRLLLAARHPAAVALRSSSRQAWAGGVPVCACLLPQCRRAAARALRLCASECGAGGSVWRPSWCVPRLHAHGCVCVCVACSSVLRSSRADLCCCKGTCVWWHTPFAAVKAHAFGGTPQCCLPSAAVVWCACQASPKRSPPHLVHVCTHRMHTHTHVHTCQPCKHDTPATQPPCCTLALGWQRCRIVFLGGGDHLPAHAWPRPRMQPCATRARGVICSQLPLRTCAVQGAALPKRGPRVCAVLLSKLPRRVGAAVRVCVGGAHACGLRWHPSAAPDSMQSCRRVPPSPAAACCTEVQPAACEVCS
jgi:hypothetical protein